MDPGAAQRLLKVLIENSRRILDEGFGVNAAESTFFDVVEILRSRNDLRDEFIALAKATLDLREPGQLRPGTVPLELIELVAHEMRWDELRRIAEDRLLNVFGGDRRLAVGDAAARIEQAFNDGWPDRQFYRRYTP